MKNIETSINDEALYVIKDAICKQTAEGLKNSEVTNDFNELKRLAVQYHEQYIPLKLSLIHI